MNNFQIVLLFLVPFLLLFPTFSFSETDSDSKLDNPDVDLKDFTHPAFVEEIVIIPQSNQMEYVILDGKWTDDREWKQSGYDGWKFSDGHGIIFRSAHQGNYLYFLIDFISDRVPEKNMDRAVICLESNNEKNLIAKDNSHCFIATMKSSNPVILQGGSPSAIDGNFKRIYHDDVIAVGTVSDFKDRYSQIPHSTYEFKIPTDLVGRHTEYGLYIAVYDFHNDNLYSWPRNIELENNFQIPSPSKWGVIISPDKTLPEFEFPLLLSVLSFSAIIYLSKRKMLNLSFLKYY